MPAYSYKRQFCEYVKEGTKPHTIRGYRKNPAKVGDTLSHYYAMRTKHCTLLRKDTCTAVKTIAITAKGTVVMIDNPQLPPAEVDGLKTALVILDRLNIDERDAYNYDNSHNRPSRPLTDQEKDTLAWKDGFRPQGSSLHQPAGAFAMLMEYGGFSDELPFVGNIIYWDPFN
jgi:hypothetical protein